MNCDRWSRSLLVGSLVAAVVGCAGRSTMIRTVEVGRTDDDSVRVAVLHIAPRKGDRESPAGAAATLEANWEQCEPLIRRAAAAGAKVVVTPEYSTSGNEVKPDDRRFSSTAVPEAPTAGPLWDDRTVKVEPFLLQYARLADELSVYLVTHVLEREQSPGEEEPTYYNTMIAFDPAGQLIAKYRKINLYGFEYIIESSGDETACFDTPWGRFGMLLCFDALVPWTISRCQREHNVDFWVCQSLWQQVPLPGHAAMNFLAAYSGHPVLWSNRSSDWGMAGGAGIIRPGLGNDDDFGLLADPGVMIGNLPLPDRVAKQGRN